VGGKANLKAYGQRCNTKKSYLGETVKTVDDKKTATKVCSMASFSPKIFSVKSPSLLKKIMGNYKEIFRPNYLRIATATAFPFFHWRFYTERKREAEA
jgi:hypothetical protein